MHGAENKEANIPFAFTWKRKVIGKIALKIVSCELKYFFSVESWLHNAFDRIEVERNVSGVNRRRVQGWKEWWMGKVWYELVRKGCFY